MMKNNRAQIQIIAVVIVIAVLGFVFFVRDSPNSSSDSINSELIEEPLSNNSLGENVILNETKGSGNKGISFEGLSKHNSKEDCYIVYDSRVYDITPYIPRHPGGENKIIPNCGNTKFEEAFTKKHGTSKVGLLMKVGTFIGDFDVVGDLNGS